MDKAVKEELEAAEKKAAEKKAAEEAAKSNKRKADDSTDGSDDSDSDSDDAPAAKKVKVDIEALKSAAEEAKKAYKANKADKSLKEAYKAAKAAVAEAEAGNGAVAAEEPKEEAAKEEEPKKDALAGLKKKAPAAAANSSDKAPNAKLFIGNLSWDIDDDKIKEFFKECGEPVDLHWLTDRESGRFKGCGFIEFESVELAKLGFAKNGEEVMGRPIKIDYATPRPGGDFKKKGGSKFQNKPIGEMPEGCTTAFAGNLSFDIDEDGMREFAKDCGDVKNIRWLTDRESGDFKGCGFIEFYDGESVKKFVAKNGTDLLGRAVRLDYSAPRPPRD